MVFVEQTQTGAPFGDCVRASYASFFGCPLSAIPRFDPGYLEGRDQLEEERRWLRSLGLDLVVVPIKGADVPEGLWHLMSGLSPRGFGHRCVGRGGKLVWDPHPSHAGLVELWSYAFVVPLLGPQEVAPDLLGLCCV